MSSSSDAQSTDDRIVSKSRAYVVYDKTTGEILHVHHTVSFAHGAPVHEKPEARALRLAGIKAGANAEVLEVDSNQFNQFTPMRVDTARRVVVPN
jgi:hypothetical protein